MISSVSACAGTPMLLDSIGVPAQALTLEITEDVLMADAARTRQVLDGLRRLGVQLSRDLGMTMVVEGVEDADALAALCEWHCDIAQGFHVARPMPAADFLPWLTARSMADVAG